MAGFFQTVLQGAANTAKENIRGAVNGFFSEAYLRDYTHASKTFTVNSYQYAPKLKFLFHVYFDISQEANVFSKDDHLSLTVKTVKLPSYSFDTAVLNQYNRKRIIQTKMKYDPIQITFHDDGGNLSRDLWKTYSQYYYGDLRRKKSVSNTTPINYNSTARQLSVSPYSAIRTQYQDTMDDLGMWGLQSENIQNSAGFSSSTAAKVPFFNSIIVYGFNQHDFVMYKLVNPIITQFSHDMYTYSEGSGIMENSMTVDYEYVEYDAGKLDGTNPSKFVKDFAGVTNYDRRPSPLLTAGTNASILGQGGLLDAAGGIMNDLNQIPPNILGAVRTAGITYNTFKNGNLNTAVQNQVNSIVSGAIRTNINSVKTYATPSAVATPTLADQWKTSINTGVNSLNFVPPKII